MKNADILILGAGCAGTLLAHFLEEYGYKGKVVLLDGRTSFSREQRWCGWAKLPSSLMPLAEKSWRKWTICDEKNSIVRSSDKFTYRQIYAPHFFAAFHPKWENSASSFSLQKGERVEKTEEKANFVEVSTDKNTWRANLVFDARHRGSENLRNLRKSNHIFLNQTFWGLTVEFPRPVFEIDTAVLMDFRTEQSNNGINFIYVLPYSEREALIESTCFSANFTDTEKHRKAVEKYTRENFGDDYQIKSEESGKLPMTTATFPVKSGERFYSIGVAGGSARPSSGYAFHRILRQTSRIARAIVQKEPIPKSFDSLKYRFLDTVFLESIVRCPQSAKEFFLRMFGSADADSLIRFLLDESSLRDDSAVISALPKIPFGIAFGQSLQRQFTRQNGQNTQLQASLENLFDSVGKPFRRLSDWRVSR